MSGQSSSPETIFAQAIAIADEEARGAFLDRACADDPGLRQEVEQLVRDHFRAGDFLDAPADQIGITTSQPATDHRGSQIGPYKLVQQIGEGGMGMVYLAEQSAPVARRVALKIVKPGMDSHQVIARFEAERQALALMDHPNIAKVLDAGTTESGQPYFVMELVKGIPITQYCDERQLAPQKRLELFATVCHAVQHAHQKGIIHRDLKPSNVLVAEYDERPVAKVIDFGVAKAVGLRLSEKTVITEFGQVVGTIEYMSPEQAKLNQLDIDTRTDVYSLGVLLYELLTGETPFDRQRLRDAAFDEMLRIIREEEPPRPSTRLSGSGSLPSVAANRHLEPGKLTALMRGELDWIVMKSLEKDRSRRYETANGLAMDIQRYLANEPVLAGPPSAIYRFRKFARRNKAPVLAATFVLIALLLGLTGATIGLLQARVERDNALLAKEKERLALLEAEKNYQTARQSVDKMFTQVAEKWLARRGALELLQEQFLTEALHFYEEFAKRRSADPDVRLEAGNAYRRIGQIHDRLGRPVEAKQAFDQAITILQALVGEFPDEPKYRAALAACYLRLGYMFHFSDQNAEALEADHEAMQRFEELAAEFPANAEYRRDAALSQSDWAEMLNLLGSRVEAEAAKRRAIRLFEELPPELADEPDNRFQLGLMRSGLAEILYNQHRLSEAWPLLYSGKSIYEQLVAEFPFDPIYRNELAWTLHIEGLMLAMAGRPPEAERAYRQALAIAEKQAAESSHVPDYQYVLGFCYKSLGAVLISMGRPEEAEQALGKSIDILEKLIVAHPNTRHSHVARLMETYKLLASSLSRKQRDAAAEQLYSEAVRRFSEITQQHPHVMDYGDLLARQHYQLGMLQRRHRRAEEAEKNVRQAIAIWNQLMAEVPEDSADRARLLQSRSRAELALQEWDAALAGYDELIEADPAPLAEVLRALNAGGRSAQAEQFLLKVLQRWPRNVEVHRIAGDSYVAWRQPEKALEEYSKAIELGQAGDATPWCYLGRANAYQQLQQADKALDDLSRAIELWPETWDVWHWRGYFAFERQHWDEAIADVSRSIELNLAYWENWRLRAVAHEKLRHWAQAIADYGKALELNPSHADTHNQLARMLITCPEEKYRDPPRAVELAKTAVELDSQRRYWNTLGAAQYRAGDWNAAITALQKSMELGQSGDAFDWFLLAMAHWQLGDKQESRKWYDRAVEWTNKSRPTDEELHRIRAEAAELLEVDNPAAPMKPEG